MLRGDSKSSIVTSRHQFCLPFLVLDLALHVIDGVRALHLEGDGLARECLYKDLHGYEGRRRKRWIGGDGSCSGWVQDGKREVGLISGNLTQRHRFPEPSGAPSTCAMSGPSCRFVNQRASDVAELARWLPQSRDWPTVNTKDSSLQHDARSFNP